MFGHVIEGERYLDQIELMGVDTEHKPFADIRIADCGMVSGYGREDSPVSLPVAVVPAPAALPIPSLAPPVATGLFV